jgi:hypothetical protein
MTQQLNTQTAEYKAIDVETKKMTHDYEAG